MRQQNFHKKAHTARFLQTFHSGVSSTGRNYRAEMPAPSEAAAVEFVKTGQAATFAAPTASATYVVEHRGFKVLHGEGLVTEKQAKWIISIALDSEGPTEEQIASLRVRMEQGFAKRAGSQFIDSYRHLPKRTPSAAAMEAIAPGASTQEHAAATAPRHQVRDGRYAVEHEGTLKFFKLKNGRNAGYVFLDVQASDDWHPIRNPKRIDEILALIAADELTAARRYGTELGKCSRCGRTLTDETSRAYGIGPDCRAK